MSAKVPALPQGHELKSVFLFDKGTEHRKVKLYNELGIQNLSLYSVLLFRWS